MTTGVLTTTATLYYGPSTTNYLADISFPAGTQFNVLWQEGLWYYVSVQGGARRNYVLAAYISVTGSVPAYTAAMAPRIINAGGFTRLGPTTNYPTGMTLNPGDTVYYVSPKKEGDFALLETIDRATGKFKRVWFPHMNLGMYSGPVSHRYTTGTYNGITLHILRTHANNIKLLDQTGSSGGQKALQNSGYFGCNGGWFNMSTDQDILNIAMNDGGKVGSGTYGGLGNYVGSGAIAWNGNAWALSHYTNAPSYSSIGFSTQTNTWAQGGFHLWLGHSGWRNNFINQPSGSDFIDGAAYRTAMIANMTSKSIYLIVALQSVTVTAFRSAIQSYLNISDASQLNSTIQGILLDGGGSSQLRAKSSSGSVVNAPQTRPLAQIVVLKDAT